MDYTTVVSILEDHSLHGSPGDERNGKPFTERDDIYKGILAAIKAV